MLSGSQIERIGKYLMANLPIMYDVDSSNVASAGMDDATGTFYVRFLPKGNSPGSLYAYYGVESSMLEEFFAASSKGQFIWQYLRGRYTYERIE